MKKILFSLLFLATALVLGTTKADAADITITSISPTSAKVGETVTLTGTNFPTSALIHFSNADGYSSIAVKPTTITPASASFVVPFNFPVGKDSINIGPDPAYDLSYGVYKYPTSNDVTLAALESTPVITSISPSTIRVGDRVTVTGTGFNYGCPLYVLYQTTGLSTKSTMQVSAAMTSPTSITFTMPFGPKGESIFQLGGNPSGATSGFIESNKIVANVQTAAPILKSIAPTTARRGVPTTFTFDVENGDFDSVIMLDNTQLGKINGRTCTGPGFGNQACIPLPSSLSTGMHTLQIKQMDSGLMSNSLSFTLIDSPVISSLGAPYWTQYTVGSSAPDSTMHLVIRLLGIGFDQNSLPHVDTTSSTALKRWSEILSYDHLVDIELPNTLVPGSTHTIQIKQSDTGNMSNIVSFTVPAKPTGETPPTPTPTPTPVCANNNCSTLPPTCTLPKILVNNICTVPFNPANPITPTPAPITTQTNKSTQTNIQAQIELLRAKIAAMNSGTTTQAPTTNTRTPTAQSCTNLTKNLSYKSSDAKTEGQVTLFQQFLQNDGYLTTSSFGYFGPATLKATKAFQRTEGINPTGYVGPLTRAKIQALSCQ